MSTPLRCPVHANESGRWACPDDCPHFLDELDRRIDDVIRNGNFTRTWVGDDGTVYRQTSRCHQPVGQPRPVRKK